MRQHFGNDWRLLEAPRHLSIPSMRQLEANLSSLGFTTRQGQCSPLTAAAESSRIRRRGAFLTRQDMAAGKMLEARIVVSTRHDYDFVELVCVKGTKLAADGR
jgi:hypothetical protein